MYLGEQKAYDFDASKVLIKGEGENSAGVISADDEVEENIDLPSECKSI